MRSAIVSAFVVSLLTSSAIAFAEDPAASVTSSTSTVPGGTSTTTTANVSAGTGPIDTTSTTQAAIDTTPVTPGNVSTTEFHGETKTTWINRPLLTTGFVLLGGTYAASAIVGAESNNSKDHPNLYYPVVGPWLDLAQRGPGAGDKVLIALDGVGQGIGALSIVTAFFLPEKVGRNYFFVASDKLTVAPTTVGNGGYGLGAAGKF